MTKKPTAISLFSGAGGLDYGFEAAGFATGACVEVDHDCCESLRLSRPKWNVIERSIFDVSADEILETASCRVKEPSVLIGGPPCQPFSKAAYWATGDSKRLSDERARTLSAYLRVLGEIQPEVFVLENVLGLKYAGKDEGLTHVRRGIDAINRRKGTRYKPVIAVLNAAEYGVPQTRERVFIVGARDGTRFAFPQATHGDPTAGLRDVEPYRTAWDALGDLPADPNDEDLALRGKWAELLPSIPEGQNYLWHTEQGIARARARNMRAGRDLFGWRTRFWTFLLKLAKDRPSWTIQAQPGPAIGPFHWKNRRLSARELCRLQTFPESAKIHGGRTSVQRQAGNAVPSLLGEVLAREIRTQLLGLSKLSRRAPLLLPPRRETASAEPYYDPDRKFRAYEGHHHSHPGTGMGAGALRRQLTLQ